MNEDLSSLPATIANGLIEGASFFELLWGLLFELAPLGIGFVGAGDTS